MEYYIEHLIAEMKQNMPPVFLGSKIDELTGFAIAWGSVQNKRSRREIPNEDEIFIRSGNRILVVRDPFIEWFAKTLRKARGPATVRPPRRSRRARHAGEPDRASR